MLFSKNTQLPLTNKKVGSRKRAGFEHEGQFLYYGASLTRYYIALRKARRARHVFQIIGGIVFSAGLFVFFFWQIGERELTDELLTHYFWYEYELPLKAVFWFSFFPLLYVWYRLLTRRVVAPEMDYSEKKEKKKQKQHVDISKFFTKEAVAVLEDAYRLADKYNAATVQPIHVFVSLLSSAHVQGIFLRLLVPVKKIQAEIIGFLKKGKTRAAPALSADMQQILVQAYLEARTYTDSHVRNINILVACVGQSEQIQEWLYDLNVDKQKLINVVAWVRVREQLRERFRRFKRAAAEFSKYGLDKAMTAVATPFLNSISQDLTIAAKYHHLEPCVAREKEIEEMFRIIEGGRQSIILVGEQGVGKMSIVEGVTQRMLEGRVPERLRDKRLVQISTSALLAGTTVSGAQERLLRVMNEVAKAKNIILFINSVHDLVGGSQGDGEGLDVAETLAEYLGSGKFFTFATTTPNGYNRHIVHSSAGKVFARVDIEEMDTNQAIQVLESKVGMVEYKHDVYFSYDAIEQCVVLAAKFLHDQNIPESALAIMSEVASYIQNKGERKLVTREDVGVIIGQKTGIPSTSISEDESSKLLRLEDDMHKRVIGQDEAVVSVANALRRARTEIRSTKRPIANFLFLGPTGVGKTELAKTIASTYFGGEDRMIRIDMSEYQDKSGIYRLIGQPGQQGTGILTEAVRQNPFSLLLLDELEKADPNILNLFLQVFDDGRLTDSVGRVIDFTNVIIIATTNAGTRYVQKRLEEKVALSDIREELMRGQLQEYYRPEFLNRFDGIILFKPLNRSEIVKIAGLMLARVERDLLERGVALRVEDEALEALAEAGYDPQFGARPMRRAIQDLVENKLAELILARKLERRDTVVLGAGCEVRVERKS